MFGSHDGMGRKPVLGLLPDADLERMVQDLVTGHGALPNYSRQPGGGRIIYELCATPWSLINRTDAGEPLQLQVDRYVACVALGLTLRGVPAFYINGRYLSGARPVASFKTVIDEELKKAKQAIKGGIKQKNYYKHLVKKGKKSL